LSFDHKPDNEGELKRIENAGHMVEDSRVDGNLALSRAFGDY
jgi:serine/threonine protein phosphatase PrpC